MEKSKKMFRYAFFSINIIIIILFILIFIYQLKSNSLLDAFLIGASSAGFFGLVGQMILTLVQEYHQRKTYKICYVCRESAFSETIADGIKEYYSKQVDVEFDLKIIPKDPNEKMNFLHFLQKETKKYNGIIIRPIEVSNEFFLTVQSLVKEKKEIVMVDLNFSKEHFANFPSFNHPVYVGSDFSQGGRLVADQICNLVNSYGKESTEIIALLGPEDLPSSRKRGKNIVWELSKRNMTDISTFLNVKNFDVFSCTDIFNECLQSLEIADYKNKNLIIFCANDTVAIELMKQQVTQSECILAKFAQECKSIHYIGYDGMKDSSKAYLLERYSLEYTTIDVLPYKQGEKAAELLLDELLAQQRVLKFQELIRPKMITNKELV